MRRGISLLLAMLCLFCLYGCDQEDGVLFFYPRTEIQYGSADAVIASEARDIDNTGKDMTFLLKLYLEGPISQELRSPFPRGTTLESLSYAGGQLFVVLNEPFAALENMDYLIACACIASTCFELTEATSVTVKTQQTSLTLTRDTLMLEDIATASSPK